MEPKVLGESPDKRFALLIDADNVSAKYIKPILDELSKYGTVTIKRIYGDWTLTLHAKWKDALLENSITPIQQFSYTYGKNATDSAMIIDAMDILYGGQVEGFCLVSSDSDFTRLASRLRESGLTVVGMGEKKTPTPFRRACDIFTTLELLVQSNKSNHSSANGGPSLPINEVEQAVVDIITDNSNNGKATGLGEVGSRLLKRYPEFDVRSYGTNLLSKLLEDFTRVVIKKDRNNLTVELAEAVPKDEAAKLKEDTAKPKDDAAKAKEDATKPKDEAAKPKEGDGKLKEGGASGEQKSAKKGLLPEKPQKALPKGEGGSKKKLAPAAAEKDKPAGEETPESKQPVGSDANELPEKPHRVRRTRSAKKALEAEGLQDAAVEEKAAAEQLEGKQAAKVEEPAEKPKKAAAKKALPEKKTTPAKVEKSETAVAAIDSEEESVKAAPLAEQPVAAKPKKPQVQKRASSKKSLSAKAKQPKQQTPASFIQSIVDKAGTDGMNVADVGNALRRQFKDFKVKDLGYPRLATYLQEQPLYRLERRDGVVYVFTKNAKA